MIGLTIPMQVTATAVKLHYPDLHGKEIVMIMALSKISLHAKLRPRFCDHERNQRPP